LTKVEPVSHYPRFFGFTVAILATIIVGSAHAVTIATVPVGYAGNVPDPRVASDGTSGYGAVSYNYQIGTYDVTNAQYAEFLNAKASAADPYFLWNSYMGNSDGAAITRSGSGPFTYSVKPVFADKPVIHVTMYDALRFVNWLQNGEGNGDTESGTYLITGGALGNVLVPDGTQRAVWAATNSFHWLLPSEDEWYKAAYYNGVNGSYYAYPYQSDSLPSALAPPGNANSGNFLAATRSTGSFYTDVGAYPNSLSPFGSFDMGGNVNQWSDTAYNPLVFLNLQVVRGGYWGDPPENSAAASRGAFGSARDDEDNIGFRVASVGGVPEPSTGLLAELAGGIIWMCRSSSPCRRIARRGVLRNDAGI
jgi:formylglycine-generating enzyme